MNIEKALEHQAWRLKNSKSTERDLEAFNSIIDWKRLQEQKSLKNNDAFAKLWIHQLILLNENNMYSGERSIQVIDEILDKSVYQWILTLMSNLNIMRFKALLKEKSNLIPDDILNAAEHHKNVLKLMNDHKEELTKALTDEIKEDNVIRFVEKMVNRVV